MAGTYRIRYRTAGERVQQAPELQYDGFDGVEAAPPVVSTTAMGTNGRHSSSSSSSTHRAITAAAAPVVQQHYEYRHHSSSSEGAQQQQQPGYEPAWALPIPGRTTKGKLSGMESKAEAFLVVQAVVAEESRNATWVEEALKSYLRPYLKDASLPATTTTSPEGGVNHRHGRYHQRALASPSTAQTAIPFQMPRRFLPAGDRCNDSALLWPAHFTLHLANASAVYPVINKLHALLVSPPTPASSDASHQLQQEEQQQQQLPHLCSVNVTLLNSGFSAVADGRTAAAPVAAAASPGGSGSRGAAAKVPPNVVLMLAFAGGACLILLGFFAYRQLAQATGGGVRTSRRSSVQHWHDPTTIEQQITELDDSLSSTTLGVKASALRHNSRSRNNSMTGLSAHAVVFPAPRIPAHGPSHRLSGSISISGSNGSTGADTSGCSPASGGGGGPTTTVGSIAHFRSSSSLPTDLDAAENHGRSASLPHNGFGFFLPRRSSFHNSNSSNSNDAGASSTSGSEGPQQGDAE